MAPTNLEKAVADRDALIVCLELAADHLKENSINPLEQDKITDLIQLLIQTQSDLMDVNRRIIGYAPSDINQHTTTFKTLYTQALSLLSSLRSLKSSGSTTSIPMASSSSSCEVRLPPLELPFFNGDLLQWVPFRDMFQSAVHNKQTLSDAQKLTYLKGQLKGEASRLIQSMLITDANYQIAWDQLTSRYQNDREILFAILRNLDNMPVSHPNSHSSVRHVIDTSRECVRSLEVLNLPVDQWDAILLFFVVKKLDQTSRQLWEQGLKDSSIPPLSSLFEFLEQRARALAAGVTDSKGSKSSLLQRDDKPKYKFGAASSFHATVSSCPNCKESFHPLFKCQKFINSDVKTRIDQLRTMKACFNCLSSFHSVSKCPNAKTCRRCGSKHHTLIHQESANPENPAPSGNVSHHVQSSVPRKKNVHPHSSTCRKETNKETNYCGTLLSTARVRVLDHRGQPHSIRILLDNGSNSNYATSSCIQSLGLLQSKSFNPAVGLNGTTLCTTTSVASVTLMPHFDSNVSFETSVNVIPKITNQLPHSIYDVRKLNYLKLSPLADPVFYIPQNIDMLLGAEFFYSILQPAKQVGPDGCPSAVSTTFGWIIGGGSNPKSDAITKSLFISSVPDPSISLDQLLTRFWEQEEVREASQTLTADEQKCITHFESTHRRTGDGRFVVQLPFKPTPPVLGLSLHSAIRRFKSMEKRLKENHNHYEDYRKFMKEYEDLGHMVEVNPDSENPPHTYYIPHHFVLKQESTTTKFRVVFDASAKTTTGSSLNDTMMIGPTLQDTLMNIVIRFRLHKIAFTADIQKMYRQVQLDPSQTDLQRIVWRNQSDEPIKHYKLLTVTYGTASAPYLATAVLNQLARINSQKYPLAAEIVSRDFYVDDLMSGSSSVQNAVIAQSQLLSLCDSGQLPLRKWTSNSQEFLQHVPLELQETKFIPIEDNQTVKTLGIVWNPKKDVFSFRYSHSSTHGSTCMTKRQILSDISSLFDPIGWLAPVVIKAKILMQQIHITNQNWDDQVPVKLQEIWLEMCHDLKTHLKFLVTTSMDPQYKILK